MPPRSRAMRAFALLVSLPMAGVAGAQPHAIDATAAPFLAVGDGRTDNSAAFSRIFAATDSPTIRFPPGTYRLHCGAFKAASSVSLEGDPGARIVLDPGCRLTDHLFSWEHRDHVSIRSLSIDVARAVPEHRVGILHFKGASGFVVDHVDIASALAPVALVSVVSNGATVSGFSITHNRLALAEPSTEYNQCIDLSVGGGGENVHGDVVGNTCVGTAISVAGSDVAVTGNDIGGWGFGAGVYVSAHDTARVRDIVIAGNLIHDGAPTIDANRTPSHGVESHGAQVLVLGNAIRDNGGNGVMAFGPRTEVVGNIAYDNGRRADGLRDAGFTSFYGGPDNNADGSVFIGNISFDSGPGTQEYGYDEAGRGLAGVRLSGNDFSGPVGDVHLAPDSGTAIVARRPMRQSAAGQSQVEWTGLADRADAGPGILHCRDLSPVGASGLRLEVATGSPPVWSASGYQSHVLADSKHEAPASAESPRTGDGYTFGPDQLAPGGRAALVVVFPAAQAGNAQVRTVLAYVEGNGTWRNITGTGLLPVPAGDITGIRLRAADGTFATGRCELYPGSR